MEQQLCPTFVNNDIITIVYSKEEEGIPCFDSFQRLHPMKQNFGLQNFPSHHFKLLWNLILNVNGVSFWFDRFKSKGACWT